MESKNSVLEVALACKRAGLDVIPDHPIEKYPVGFPGWQKKKFTDEELTNCILNMGYGIGIRNQEGLDFDNHNNAEARKVIKEWKNLVDIIKPGLVDRLLLETTQHGGYHLAWKCKVIENSQKLASRQPTSKELQKDPKVKSVSFIETRGLGGQFVVSPTPDPVANWEVFTNTNGYSLRYPNDINIGNTGYMSQKADDQPNVRLYENKIDPLADPHMNIVVLSATGSLESEAMRNYQANMAAETLSAKSLKPLTRTTFLQKEAFEYSFTSKGFVSPAEEYLGYEGEYNVLWVNGGEKFYMIAWTKTPNFDQILATFQFTE